MQKQIKMILGSLGILVASNAMATDLDPSFTYQGRFVDSSGHALVGAIKLRFQIFSPNGKCLLYEEMQSTNVPEISKGVATVKVGSTLSSSKRTSNDPGLLMHNIFSNEKSFNISSANCSTPYTPKSGDARSLKVFMNDGIKETALSSDQSISTVPTALVAESLQGLNLMDFDSRYILGARLTNLVSGKFCYADGNNIKCDRDIASLQGTPGAKGEKGDKGDAGTAGVAGAKGAQGEKGLAGAVGPKGDKGDAGIAGVAGAKGAQGEKGLTGAVGPKGDKGDAGTAGVAGAKGAQGEKGLTGAVGPKGDKGDAGAKGAQGDRGPAGMSGANGAQGAPGLQGPQGVPGLKGDRGVDGKGISSLGQECADGSYLKGLNTNGSLRCESLASVAFNPSKVKVFSAISTTNAGSISVFCPVGAVRLSCSGTRQSKQQDTCNEEDCGLIGVIPVDVDGKQGCNTAIDTGSGTQAAVYAVCYVK